MEMSSLLNRFPENNYEILLDEAHVGAIYVKSMQNTDPLPWGSSHLNKNRGWNSWGGADGQKAFGYNFLTYVLQARDRRGSIPFDKEKKEIEAAWVEVLLSCNFSVRGGKKERGRAVELLFDAIWE